MPDEAVEQDGVRPQDEEKGKMKLVIMGAAAIISLAGGLGAASYINGFGPFGAKATAESQLPDRPVADIGDAELFSETALFPLDQMYVNITAMSAGGEIRDRVLGITLMVVYDAAFDHGTGEEKGEDAEGDVSGMAAKAPFIRDTFISYLRQISERDLQGSAGIATVKAELVKRARAVTGSTSVRDVLISDLIIQ